MIEHRAAVDRGSDPAALRLIVTRIVEVVAEHGQQAGAGMKLALIAMVVVLSRVAAAQMKSRIGAQWHGRHA